ncbi:MAG: helix-turn-helix domain-containing protein [Lachnospiraceae bacterium]|nr:helix-turn-helix domain-containing protein [Lachnospiraceae bacterium]
MKKRKYNYVAEKDIFLAKNGDWGATFRILDHYEKDIVRCIIKKAERRGVWLEKNDIEDITEEVRLTLIKAIRKFDI